MSAKAAELQQALAPYGMTCQAEPTRAIYYGVFFRDHNGNPQVATDHFWTERRYAEMFIELSKSRGMKTAYFIATLSVPVSETEAAQ